LDSEAVFITVLLSTAISGLFWFHYRSIFRCLLEPLVGISFAGGKKFSR